MAIDLEAMSPEDAAFARRVLAGINFKYVGDKATDLTRDPIFERRIKMWPVEAAATVGKSRGPSEPEEQFMLAASFAKAAGCILEWDSQPEPAFKLDGNTEYEPDFKLELHSGQKIYVETKGRKMTSEKLTRMKLRQCSTRYPENIWWLARWSPRLPWRVQVVESGVIRRKPITVDWLS